MAVDRNDKNEREERRPASITTPPAVTTVPAEDDDRVIFWSWDEPLIPANTNR
jgi:hypothetical protein